MLSLGIDYEAGQWKLAAWNEDRAADLLRFGSEGDVWESVEDILSAHPATPIVLPSGFGIPVTRARELLDRDIAEITLHREAHVTDPLGQFLAEARRRPLRAFCIPSVRLLPSIPLHRKLNQVDLGTADVLCAAAWAIHCLAQGGPTSATSHFLLLHVGADKRALVAIRDGRIVDGIGRSAWGMGTASRDSAGAFLTSLGQGIGRSHAAGGTEKLENRLREARNHAFWETVEKESVSLLAFHGLSQVVVTGPGSAQALQAAGDRLPITPLPSQVDGYEAALGAALIAAGLTGGPTANLVDHLELRQVRERVFDWIVP